MIAQVFDDIFDLRDVRRIYLIMARRWRLIGLMLRYSASRKKMIVLLSDCWANFSTRILAYWSEHKTEAQLIVHHFAN